MKGVHCSMLLGEGPNYKEHTNEYIVRSTGPKANNKNNVVEIKIIHF